MKKEIPLFKARASRVNDLLGQKGLGKTGETYVKDFLTELRFGYRKEFSNKYTKKGLACEDAAIELVTSVYDLGFLQKNTEPRKNDFVTGECDIYRKVAKQVRDIKCSWWAYTFPWLETECTNPVYIAQGNTYMWLWDVDDYVIDYCLMDAPEKQITAAYWNAHRDAEIDSDEVDGNLFEEVRSKMIHSHLPEEARVKSFTIKRDEEKIKLIQERVGDARELVKSILKIK